MIVFIEQTPLLYALNSSNEMSRRSHDNAVHASYIYLNMHYFLEYNNVHQTVSVSS